MIAPAARPGAQPQPPQRRHCTLSTGGPAAFCSDDGAMIGAAFAATVDDDAPAARTAARSLEDILMTTSPFFVTRPARRQTSALSRRSTAWNAGVLKSSRADR